MGVWVACVRTLANIDSRSISGHDGVLGRTTAYNEGPSDGANRPVQLPENACDRARHGERSCNDRFRSSSLADRDSRERNGWRCPRLSAKENCPGLLAVIVSRVEVKHLKRK